MQALQDNPQAYFSTRRSLEAAEHDGQIYVLLYTSEPKSITHDRGGDWALEATGQTVDSDGPSRRQLPTRCRWWQSNGTPDRSS